VRRETLPCFFGYGGHKETQNTTNVERQPLNTHLNRCLIDAQYEYILSITFEGK
jgi:hypothetical protein